jgi:hypothetical protein
MQTQRSTFGMLIPGSDEYDQIEGTIRRVGTGANIAGIVRLIRHDMELAAAAGRWEPGQPDPDRYVPGDVPALRSIPCGPLLLYLSDPETDQDLLYSTLLTAAMVYTSRPFFLDTQALQAVISTDPPPAELVRDARLPFPRLLVLFGQDLPVPDPVWPPGLLGRPEPAHTASPFRHRIMDAMQRRGGGAICGVVLFASDESSCRGLGDLCCWLVSVNPDPQMAGPASADRQRGLLLGVPSLAELQPLLHNLALVVSSAVWHAMPDQVPGIGEPGTGRWARSLSRHRARQAILAGAGTGVRILDLAASRQTAASHAEPTGRHLAAHPRRGHYRRSRVATRGPDGRIMGNVHGEHGRDWHYLPHWIPPRVVGSGPLSLDQVWRLPPAQK